MRGTSVRPRLSIFRSARHIYVQAVDDINGVTVASASSLQKDGDFAGKDPKEAATMVGKLVAESLKAKSVEKVVFDRNGYRYHGRVKALADGAREAGLDF